MQSRLILGFNVSKIIYNSASSLCYRILVLVSTANATVVHRASSLLHIKPYYAAFWVYRHQDMDLLCKAAVVF